MSSDQAMRILGASDGYAHALVRVREKIGYIRSRMPLSDRHTRKIAALNAQLAPLLELEKFFLEQHAECRDTYRRLTSEAANLVE